MDFKDTKYIRGDLLKGEKVWKKQKYIKPERNLV